MTTEAMRRDVGSTAGLGITCPHCQRHIPDSAIYSYDLSGCPLEQQCIVHGHLAVADAWPNNDDDDDDDAAVCPCEPALSGGAA